MLAIDIFKTVSRKGAKIAKPQRRVKSLRRAFASLRSLRLCVKNLSAVFGLEELVGSVDGEEFVGGAVDVRDRDICD